MSTDQGAMVVLCSWEDSHIGLGMASHRPCVW